MADVFRGKSSVLSAKLWPGYMFHGVTAILVIVFIFKALNVN